MGRLLLLLVPMLLLGGCGTYGSLREASDACSNWREQGGTFTRDFGPYYDRPLDRGGGNRYVEMPVRSCTTETETRQVLGLVGPYAKGTEGYDWELHQGKVQARFRY